MIVKKLNAEQFNKYILWAILLIGVVSRLLLFNANLPNNVFDDHLEPIFKYAQHLTRPLPADCWQCYQPPAYYVLSAFIYNLTKNIGFSIMHIWKCVQLINAILSIGVLFIFYLILNQLQIHPLKKMLYVSFMAVLPVDIFTSAIIGNDYLLNFASITAIYFYLKCIKYQKSNLIKPFFINYFLLMLFCLIGVYTKQHGLLLLLLPLAILIFNLKLNSHITIKKMLPFFILLLFLSSFDEIWKHHITGKFLVSNQHFFNYAKDQFPGSLNQIEFFTFRIFSLFKEPYLSTKTASSFPTEIFARIFYDYEWKFISPTCSNSFLIARFAYIIGLVWLVYFLLYGMSSIKIFISNYSKKNVFTFSYLIPIIFLAILFALVPLIQTIRFPYFSCMKAMFMLPGIIIFIVLHAKFTQKITLKPLFIYTFIFINLLFGIILLSFIIYYINKVPMPFPIPLWYMT